MDRVVAYALLASGETVRVPRAELARQGHRRARLFDDRAGSPHPRPGLLAAARASTGRTLVVATLSRLAADEGDLAALTADLIDREVTLDVGGVLVQPVNERGTALLDTCPQISQPGAVPAGPQPTRGGS